MDGLERGAEAARRDMELMRQVRMAQIDFAKAYGACNRYSGLSDRIEGLRTERMPIDQAYQVMFAENVASRRGYPNTALIIMDEILRQLINDIYSAPSDITLEQKRQRAVFVCRNYAGQ